MSYCMMGKTIHMPVKLWGQSLTAYKGVKRCGKHLVFKVCKRVKGSDRYMFSAIDGSSGKMMTVRENWTLTYDQVVCHSK